MIFALAGPGSDIVMDARKDDADPTGVCVYCGKWVYLSNHPRLGRGYCHSNQQEAVACLKARSRFPR